MRHCARHRDAAWMLTQPYLAFENLISWCNTLPTIALQPIQRVLAQLNLALLVGTLKKPLMMLLNTRPLHPIGDLQEQASAFGEGALLAH